MFLYNSSPKRILFAFLIFVVSTVMLFRYWAGLTFSRSAVTNVEDRSLFITEYPTGFQRQDPGSIRLASFRKRLPLLADERNSLERAVSIRRWVRAQHGNAWSLWDTSNDRGVTDPEQLIQEMQEGTPGACRQLAYTLVGALLSDGFHARVVSVDRNFNERAARSHTISEVWISALRKWVIMDATLDRTYLVDGQPASVLDVHDVLRSGVSSRLTFQGSSLRRIPHINAFLPRFRHIYALQTNGVFDGYGVDLFRSKRLRFLHLVDTLAEPFPETQKNLALLGSILGAIASVLCGVVLLRLSPVSSIIAAIPVKAGTRCNQNA